MSSKPPSANSLARFPSDPIQRRIQSASTRSLADNETASRAGTRRPHPPWPKPGTGLAASSIRENRKGTASSHCRRAGSRPERSASRPSRTLLSAPVSSGKCRAGAVFGSSMPPILSKRQVNQASRGTLFHSRRHGLKLILDAPEVLRLTLDLVAGARRSGVHEEEGVGQEPRRRRPRPP